MSKQEYVYLIEWQKKTRRCSIMPRIDGLFSVFIERKRKEVVMTEDQIKKKCKPLK